MTNDLWVLAVVFVAMMLAHLAWAVVKALWFRVRWSCGWRPAIHDEKTIDLTVEECAAAAVACDIHAMVQAHFRPFTEEERVSYAGQMRLLLRQVIDAYVKNYSIKS